MCLYIHVAVCNIDNNKNRDVDRLYLSRDMGGRGFLSMFDAVECEKKVSFR